MSSIAQKAQLENLQVPNGPRSVRGRYARRTCGRCKAAYRLINLDQASRLQVDLKIREILKST